MDSGTWWQIVTTVCSAVGVLVGLAVYAGRILQRIDHLEKGLDADGAAHQAIVEKVDGIDRRVTRLEARYDQT